KPGAVQTNLAKVFAERGEQSVAEATLWQAVEADPNQENGVMWWLSIQQERGGEAAYLAALHTVAALPGSWRAQLWMARHYLQQQNVEQACVLYEEVLAGGQFDRSALQMISGDLGNNGHIPLIVELVGPAYDEHKHDSTAGLNLLRAYQELGRVDEGEALLTRLYALGFAPIKSHLDQFAHAFEDVRRQEDKGVPIDPASVTINTVALTKPVWHYGLRNADWLFAKKRKVRQKLVSSPCPKSWRKQNLPNRSARMISGAIRVASLFTWLSRFTTGMTMQPIVMSRSRRVRGRLYLGLRSTATHCSISSRQRRSISSRARWVVRVRAIKPSGGFH
ncbi:hypothetical protein ALP15_04481, partial [Pseudomonas savastanoi]